jgi:Icc-related predicted phosphoesterase
MKRLADASLGAVYSSSFIMRKIDDVMFFFDSDFLTGIGVVSPNTDDSVSTTPATEQVVRITAIADTHGQQERMELGGGDILLVAGDLLLAQSADSLQRYCAWLDAQQFTHKVFVAGNHDNMFVKAQTEALEIVKQFKTLKYLQNETTMLYVRGQAIRIFGSPMCNIFGAFTGSDYETDKAFMLVEEATDIILTHQAPAGVMDKAADPMKPGFGSEALLRGVLNCKPILHVFGHAHGNRGAEQHGGVVFVIATGLEFSMQVRNTPLVATRLFLDSNKNVHIE